MIVLIVMISILPVIYNFLKNSIMKWITPFFINIKFTCIRIYRILKVTKRSDFVWKDLIKYNQRNNWKFGQFETEKRIENSFKIDEDNLLDFYQTVTDEKLEFSVFILKSFDEEKTNDLLVLASHFNSLLHFGVVKVSVKHNYVVYIHSGDLLTYMLFEGEIDSDLIKHYNITKDVFWSFRTLIETGDDPVFVFSELLRRNKEENEEDNN